MKRGLNIFLVVMIWLTIIIGCAAPPSNTGIFADPQSLENEIRDKIGEFPASWEKIEFENVSNNSITVWIDYPQKPELSELERDTKRVAQAVLDVVKAKDYDPKKHMFYVSVKGNLRPPNRADNRPHPLGNTIYNSYSDNLEFSKNWLY